MLLQSYCIMYIVLINRCSKQRGQIRHLAGFTLCSICLFGLSGLFPEATEERLDFLHLLQSEIRTGNKASVHKGGSAGGVNKTGAGPRHRDAHLSL